MKCFLINLVYDGVKSILRKKKTSEKMIHAITHVLQVWSDIILVARNVEQIVKWTINECQVQDRKV